MLIFSYFILNCSLKTNDMYRSTHTHTQTHTHIYMFHTKIFEFNTDSGSVFLCTISIQILFQLFLSLSCTWRNWRWKRHKDFYSNLKLLLVLQNINCCIHHRVKLLVWWHFCKFLDIYDRDINIFELLLLCLILSYMYSCV